GLEGSLQQVHRGRRRRPARGLELLRLTAVSHPELVREQENCLGEIERWMIRIGGDGDAPMAEVERPVGKSLVLPAEDDRAGACGGPSARAGGQLRSDLAGPRHRALHAAAPRGHGDREAAVGAGVTQVVEELRRGNDVRRVVRDPLDPPGIELRGSDEPQPSEPEVLHRPHGAGDVHDVLRLPQDVYDPVQWVGDPAQSPRLSSRWSVPGSLETRAESRPRRTRAARTSCPTSMKSTVRSPTPQRIAASTMPRMTSAKRGRIAPAPSSAMPAITSAVRATTTTIAAILKSRATY